MPSNNVNEAFAAAMALMGGSSDEEGDDGPKQTPSSRKQDKALQSQKAKLLDSGECTVTALQSLPP